MEEGLQGRRVVEVTDVGTTDVVGMMLPGDAPATGDQLGSSDRPADRAFGRIMDLYIAEQDLRSRLGSPAVRGAVAGQ